jgi:iron complex outermembrane receptor protein
MTYDIRYLSQEWNGWKMSGGVNGMWQQSLNLGEETLIPEYKLFDIGGYATISKTMDNVTLNGGLRYDNRHIDFHSRNFGSVSGSIGAVWNICQHTNLRLNIARGFRAPNMSELGSDGIHEGTLRYEIGNPQLKAEYSWQADLGFDYSDKYLSAQVALFANRIQNYIFAKRIDAVIDPDYATFAYAQGDARLLGFEAGFDLHPIHQLHLGGTFSYVNAQQMHQGRDTKYLPMTPAHHWTTELKYEINEHSGPLHHSYIAIALDGYLRQSHCYRADNTETATPGYVLVNLSAGTSLVVKKKKVADVYLMADNLLDKAYQNHLSRLKYADINSATGRMGVWNMGFNFSVKAIIHLM